MMYAKQIRKFIGELPPGFTAVNILVYIKGACILLQDLQIALSKLPPDNTDHDSIIIFAEQKETAYFKPDLQEIPFDMITFTWSVEKQDWELKNIV